MRDYLSCGSELSMGYDFCFSVRYDISNQHVHLQYGNGSSMMVQKVSGNFLELSLSEGAQLHWYEFFFIRQKMINRLHNMKGFTLVEVLVSVLISGALLTTAYSAFQWIMRSQIRLSGSINIQESFFYLNTKLSHIIRNGGTNDYEEYFNRRALWYEKSMTPEWWTYTQKSKYWNGDLAGRPVIYYCGRNSAVDEDACLSQNVTTVDPDTSTFSETILWKHLAFGQYAELGFNYASLTWFPTPMRLPPIFPLTNDTLNTRGLDELYLIKKLPDSTYERIFFRHILIQDPTLSKDIKECDPTVDTQWCLWKIQMTRLVSCDRINKTNNQKPDGIIDAWVPHPLFGWTEDPCDIIQSENDIGNAADWLIWVDISTPNMHISKAQFLPRPLKIPSKMSWAGELALSSMIHMSFEAQYSRKVLIRWAIPEEENLPQLFITTLDLDDQ